MTEIEAKVIIENTPIFRYEADKTIHSDLFNALASACIALEKQKKIKEIITDKRKQYREGWEEIEQIVNGGMKK